jgi:NAD(P)-dependent dehydrogenase (short-subunit alcohol dehydrogenase family)/acyl carrier protein
MSAIQERVPDAPVVQPDQLGKLRTLAQILEHLGSLAPSEDTSGSVQQAQSANDITPVLLEVVSEKTGYPIDMLNLDMDMEADLGIDSIKRVEIMSAIQEKMPDAPVVQPDQLGKLRTLAQILEHISVGSLAASDRSFNSVSDTVTKDYSQTLLEVIADKTGYPKDMLNLEMDMEADLGIDSIKRVEILSGFQEKEPNAPVVQPADLGNFRTIGQILAHLQSGNSDVTSSDTSTPENTPETPSSNAPTQITEQHDGPAEKFELKRTVLTLSELDAEPSETIALTAGSKILILDDSCGLADALCYQFDNNGYKGEKRNLKEIIDGKFSEDIAGFVVLAPVPERDRSGLWSESSEEFIKDAFFAVQQAGPVLKKNKKALFATVSRIDGAFGLLNPTKTIDPVQGAFSGIAKTISHEWPEITSRAIDLDYRFKDHESAAKKLFEELVHQGPIEVGITRSNRFTPIEKTESIKENPDSAFSLTENDNIIVTGGARGVTAATAIEFARKFKTGMILIGRSAFPTQEPEWLNGLTEEPQLKSAILKNSKTRLSPKELESEYKKVKSSREILNTINSIAATGANVSYYSANIRDGKEIEKIIDKVRNETGKISGIIHGAGVLRDRKIEDKSRDQLDDVIDTKVKGLRNLLQALKNDDLKTVILFSSFSGRYGRSGQIDYSMANEALNKIAHKLKILRPGCKVKSFNWGPWDGGMVTPALRNVFLAEGIGLIPINLGARHPLIELSRDDDTATEIGIVGVEKNRVETENEPGKKLHKAFDYELTLKSNAWMKDHVINGRPVLPMAVTAEMLIHLAVMQSPDYKFIGYDDFRTLKGVILEDNSRQISFYVSDPVDINDTRIVESELRSIHNGHEIVNARAKILLARTTTSRTPTAIDCQAHLVYPHSINEVYQHQLFHGEFLHALTKIEGWSENSIAAESRAALPPENWSADSLCPRWYSDPLAVDAAFQLMILWSRQNTQAPSLPVYVAEYRQFCNRFPKEVMIRAKAARKSGHAAVADIDFLNKDGQVLAQIKGYECTINHSLEKAFKIREITGAEK